MRVFTLEVFTFFFFFFSFSPDKYVAVYQPFIFAPRGDETLCCGLWGLD